MPASASLARRLTERRANAERRTREQRKMTLQEQVDLHNWFHSIDFGNGVVSKGLKSLDVISIEAAALFDGLDLIGKTVLDVGAWNGALSFEAKRRGAQRSGVAAKGEWDGHS